MTNPIPGADAERAAFESAYIAEFGDPSSVGLNSGVEFAWLSGPGVMWRAARAAAKVGANVAADDPLFTADDLPKVREAKRLMIDAMIASAMSYARVGVFSARLNALIESLAAGISSGASECAPAETLKPIHRRASDVEIAQWAERHDLGRSLVDSAGMMRAAFEDAESLHQTYAGQPLPAPIAPKPCNCLQGQCCPVCDPDVCSPAPASQPTAARRDLGPSCTCDNGSLRWPCPVHPK